MMTAQDDKRFCRHIILLCMLLIMSSTTALIVPSTHAYARTAHSGRVAQTLPIEENPVPTMPVLPGKVVAGGPDTIWFIGRQTDQIGHFTTQGVSTGDAEAPLGDLSDVAWPNSKYLWLIDDGILIYYNPENNVQRFFFLHVDNPRPGEESPMARAIIPGAHGNLWVLSDNYLFQITPQLQVTYFALPFLARQGAMKGFTSDHHGNLWFTLPASFAVGFVTPTGRFTIYPLPADAFAGQPSASARWAPITALPDGNLAFLLPPSPAVWKVSPSGGFTSYPVPAGFAVKDWNSSMVADTDKTLWFTDVTNNRLVHMLCRDHFASYPIPTEDSRPASIILGPDHTIWFAETNTNLVGRFDKTTRTIAEFATPSIGTSPDHIISGPGNALWFNSTHGNAIASATRDLTGISTYMLPVGQRAESLAAGPDGNVWFVSAPNIVGRLTPDGELTEYHTTGLNSPREITRGPDGRLWFLIGGGWGTVTVDGQISQYLFPLNTAASRGSILHMVAGPDGNMWATENPNIGVIARITPQNDVSEFVFPPYAPGSLAPVPNYITVGPDGNLWFTELNSSNIGYITPQGEIHQMLAWDGTVTNSYGILTDRKGNIWYMGDTGESEDIFRLARDGTTTPFPLSLAGTITNQNVLGPLGNLWFVKTYENIVGRALITRL
ncbi:MAG TPA: hypothetical protein VGN34_11935 [Ktedonobacteraceae bacterium]